MPGTGKTTLLAHLLYLLNLLDKRVLVVSYTNTALDNLLAKLLAIYKYLANSCIRMGSQSYERITSSADAKFLRSLFLRVSDFATPAEIRQYCECRNLVFVTISSCVTLIKSNTI